MSDYKIFILIFLEVGSFMFLWNMFNKKYEKRLYKSALIVLLTSLVVLITNYIYPPVQFLTNYLFLFLAIKVTFKKNVKYLLLEFGLVLAIFGIVGMLLGFCYRQDIMKALFQAKTTVKDDVFSSEITLNLDKKENNK